MFLCDRFKWCYAFDVTFPESYFRYSFVWISFCLNISFGDSDAQALEVITKHSGPRWSETITLHTGSSGIPSPVFLFILLYFMGFPLFASYETPGHWWHLKPNHQLL